MTVTVRVYQKNGLCRGPGIGNAIFFAVVGWGGPSAGTSYPLAATGPSPLSGLEPVYTVPLPSQWLLDSFSPLWDLRVSSLNHESWQFPVGDGETHEVWLRPQ